MLRNIEAAARLSGVKVYVSVYHPGSRTTPLERDAPRRSSPSTPLPSRRAIPSFDDIIVGNEPNLNRFWLPQFGLDGANASAPAYLSAARPHVRRVEGRRPEAPRVGRRPGASRRRPSRGHAADVLAHRVHPDDGDRLPGERAHDAGDGRPRVPPVPRQLVGEPRLPAPALDVDRARGLRQARRLARRGLRRHGAAGLDTADPLRRVRDRVRGPLGQEEPLLRQRADDDEARRRDEAGGGLRPRACGSRSASRTSPGSFSSTRTTRRRCSAGSRASTTRTGRRRRASRPFATRSTGRAAARSRAATGSALDVGLRNVRFPGQAEFLRGKRDIRFRCTLDCAWEVVATRTTTGATAARVRGYGRWGRAIVASLRDRKLGRAPVRLTLTVTHPVNPGLAVTRESAELRPA